MRTSSARSTTTHSATRIPLFNPYATPTATLSLRASQVQDACECSKSNITSILFWQQNYVISSDNQLYPNILILSLVLTLGFFLLLATPLMGTWFANGRYLQGWSLKPPQKKGEKEEEWGLGLARVQTRESEIVRPPKIRVVSTWFAK